MNVEQIKYAVENGEKVYWSNHAYEVIKDNIGQWLIKCNLNDHCIGLTHQDGVTLNGKEDEFFIWYEREAVTNRLVTDDIKSIFESGAHGDFEYLSNALTGEGFKPYGYMSINELNAEWTERMRMKEEA